MLNRSRFSEKGDGEGFTDKVDNVYNSSTYAYAMHTSKTGKLITALKKEAMLEAQNTIIFTWKLLMHQKSGQYGQRPGMTNIAALVALTLIIAFFTEIIISRVVSMLMFILMFMSSCWF